MSRISILVFVASPLDYARYRHAALFIEYPSNTAIKSSLAEVVGSTGFYTYAERENWEIPIASANLARIVPVSILSDSISIPTLRETISQVPIPENGDWGEDWNSQDWICDVLERLVEIGYLDRAARDRALDGMVNAVLEARDEKV